MQSVEVSETKRMALEELLFTDFVCCGEKLFFVGNHINSLFSVDLDTKQVEFVQDRLKIVKHESAGTMRALKSGFATINLAGDVLSFYTKEGTLKEQEKIECHMHDWDNIATMENYENNIYIFPRRKKHVLKYDIVKKKIIYMDSFFEDIMEQESAGERLLICATRNNSVVYLFTKSNQMVAFDLNTEAYEIYDVPKEIRDSKSVTCYEDEIYILLKDNKVYSWKVEDKEINCIWDAEAYKHDEWYFEEMYICKEKIILLPGTGEDIVICDRETANTTVYADYPEDFKSIFPGTCSKYVNPHMVSGNKVYALLTNYMLAIDGKGKITWIKLIPPLLKDKYLYCAKHGIAISEGKIEDFLILCSLHGNQ